MKTGALQLLTLAAVSAVNAYWLMGIEDFITTERIDPIVNPGSISSHVHSVLGGSNFRFTTSTAQLRQSECTSIPIPQDKSAYWFPHLYFQWKNGSFTSVNGGAVIYYLFSDTPGTTTAFPDDFRMLSGDPLLRTYDGSNPAQQAITYLCLNFNGQSTRSNALPTGTCPNGVRAQINFPSCWDGQNTDSHDHKSHVSWPSGGADSGTCSDPNFPKTLPRIFLEVYWGTVDFDSVRSQAMNPNQPFVFSHGDPTGYGYHADFINGWDAGVLQGAVDRCHCDQFGDAQCCADQGIFDLTQGKNCRITPSIDEQTTGTLPKLPGNNPVQPAGKRATMFSDNNPPSLIQPVFAYTGDSPGATGTVVNPGQGNPTPPASQGTSISSSTSSTASTHTTTTSKTSTTTTHAPTPTSTIRFPPLFPTFSFPTFTFPGFGELASPTATNKLPQVADVAVSTPAAVAAGSGSSSGTKASTSGTAPRCNRGRGASHQSRRRQSALEKHRRSHGWYQHPHARHADYYEQ